MSRRHSKLASFLVAATMAGAGLALPPPATAQRQAGGQTRGAGEATCVDVKIGDENYYNCLNDALRRLTTQPRASSTDAPINALSPAPQVGTFNQAATSERLGSAFGHSVIPQRPPPPVYSSPLMNGR